MIQAVFFDMNETVLNPGLLKESFGKYFDDEYVVKYWFAKLLHTSTITGIMDAYKNFGELAAVVLENIFHQSGKALTPEIKADILGSFRKLPAYDDVAEALAILRRNAFRAIAVSNSSRAMIQEQLTNAGIIELFDAFYSVDAVAKYKPFKEIYLYAAREEHVAPENVVMVASHDWDLFGARRAGLKTAYIKRKNEIFNPYYARPDIAASDMVELVRAILSLE